MFWNCNCCLNQVRLQTLFDESVLILNRFICGGDNVDCKTDVIDISIFNCEAFFIYRQLATVDSA